MVPPRLGESSESWLPRLLPDSPDTSDCAESCMGGCEGIETSEDDGDPSEWKPVTV